MAGAEASAGGGGKTGPRGARCVRAVPWHESLVYGVVAALGGIVYLRKLSETGDLWFTLSWFIMAMVAAYVAMMILRSLVLRAINKYFDRVYADIVAETARLVCGRELERGEAEEIARLVANILDRKYRQAGRKRAKKRAETGKEGGEP